MSAASLVTMPSELMTRPDAATALQPPEQLDQDGCDNARHEDEDSHDDQRDLQPVDFMHDITP